jgi:hypothetical protein
MSARFAIDCNQWGATYSGLHGRQFRRFGSKSFMRFVAEMTESACQGTPLIAVTWRRFSFGGDTISRHARTDQFAQVRGEAADEHRWTSP